MVNVFSSSIASSTHLQAACICCEALSLELKHIQPHSALQCT